MDPHEHIRLAAIIACRCKQLARSEQEVINVREQLARDVIQLQSSLGTAGDVGNMESLQVNATKSNKVTDTCNTALKT